MEKVTVKSGGTYSGVEVQKMIDQSVKNVRDEIEAKRIINGAYSLEDIYDNKDVIETGNIMASDYKLKALIPAVELLGFDDVNEIVISRHKVKITEDE